MSKKYNSDYYQKNKEKLLEYYQLHKEERRLYQRDYYNSHKEQIRNWRRNRLIHYQHSEQDILVTDKKYPKDGRCQSCGRKPKGVISYHHNADNPNNGIWLCFSCHMTLHRLLKNPKLLQLIRVASLIDA